MRRTLVSIALAVATALATVHIAQRQLAEVSAALAIRPEITTELRESMDDQRRLAQLDTENAAAYRSRFDRLRALHNRVTILGLGQEEIIRTQERILFAVIAATLIIIAISYFLRRRREVARLQRIGGFVERLSAGETHLRVGERGRDAIARIARMIERTSDAIGADRQRLRYLENLSTWQEAARRHAHEIRTPLTAAQLELDRLSSELATRWPDAAESIGAHRTSIREELERLRQFTRSFMSFAAIGPPRLVRTNLVDLLDEFRRTFAAAWPMELRLEPAASGCIVAADPGLLRQVVVNLCNNSAIASPNGVVTFAVHHDGRNARIDVTDDGAGIPESMKPRMFQPYATTRRPGEGMGLGLAISKKIMLDQNGDLELTATSPSGTTFSITLPCSGHESER